MTYIAKPKVHHPSLKPNAIGLTRRDYEGAITTLCAGCGHDSISASIIQACWDLAIEPHRVAKLSGTLWYTKQNGRRQSDAGRPLLCVTTTVLEPLWPQPPWLGLCCGARHHPHTDLDEGALSSATGALDR